MLTVLPVPTFSSLKAPEIPVSETPAPSPETTPERVSEVVVNVAAVVSS